MTQKVVQGKPHDNQDGRAGPRRPAAEPARNLTWAQRVVQNRPHDGQEGSWEQVRRWKLRNADWPKDALVTHDSDEVAEHIETATAPVSVVLVLDEAAANASDEHNIAFEELGDSIKDQAKDKVQLTTMQPVREGMEAYELDLPIADSTTQMVPGALGGGRLVAKRCAIVR